MGWAQVATIIAALAAFTGVQSFWIARALDHVEARLDAIDRSVRDQGARVARLEAALG